jgi:hypothetical protein
MPSTSTHEDLTLLHSTQVMDLVGEESGEEENFQEENMEEIQETEPPDPQKESNPKEQHAGDIEEGEIIIEKTKNQGRRTNKDVREDNANKEKALGKQYSIEISLNNAGKRGGSRGADHLHP